MWYQCMPFHLRRTCSCCGPSSAPQPKICVRQIVVIYNSHVWRLTWGCVEGAWVSRICSRRFRHSENWDIISAVATWQRHMFSPLFCFVSLLLLLLLCFFTEEALSSQSSCNDDLLSVHQSTSNKDVSCTSTLLAQPLYLLVAALVISNRCVNHFWLCLCDMLLTCTYYFIHHSKI